MSDRIVAVKQPMPLVTDANYPEERASGRPPENMRKPVMDLAQLQRIVDQDLGRLEGEKYTGKYTIADEVGGKIAAALGLPTEDRSFSADSQGAGIGRRRIVLGYERNYIAGINVKNGKIEKVDTYFPESLIGCEPKRREIAELIAVTAENKLALASGRFPSQFPGAVTTEERANRAFIGHKLGGIAGVVGGTALGGTLGGPPGAVVGFFGGLFGGATGGELLAHASITPSNNSLFREYAAASERKLDRLKRETETACAAEPPVSEKPKQNS